MKKSKSGFWICVLPALICFAMVVLIPAITGLLYSFTDWNGMNKPVSFAGLENYRGLISDKVFWRDFLYTAEFSVVAVILVNLLGFDILHCWSHRKFGELICFVLCSLCPT